MKKHFLLFTLLLLISGVMCAQVTIPTVVTSQVTDITQTFATGGGTVTSDGGATVTARGVCWSTSPNPTIGGSHTTDGSGLGQFTSNITGLVPGTTYYVRAYATNSAGISYGELYIFTTIEIPSYIINVSANPADGGNVAGGGIYQEGMAVTISAIANVGYTFACWTENGTQVSTNASYTFVVTGDRTLVANFTMQAYVITAQAEPTNGGTVSGGGGYNYGQSCTLTASPSTGYNFVKWTKNGQQVGTNPTYTFTVTESATYVAHFQIQSYTITASANPSNGGTVSGGGQYNYGQNCTLTATASTGYTFVRWTENGNEVSTNASYTFTVTDNRTLIAQFQTQSFTITASANPSNGGTVTGGGTYNYGQTCHLTATANTGYTFQKWTKNGQQVSTNPNYTFTVTESAAYVAHFTQQNCTISVSADPTDGGSVSGGGNYNYGQSCTVHANANPGYIFVDWTENGIQVSASADYTFTVTSNRNLVAHFTHQAYVITAVAEPEDGGTVEGGGGYDYGDECTLKATANEGYDFIKWTKGGQQVSIEPNFSFQVTESATYVAHFEKKSFTITATADPTNGGNISGGGTYYYGDLCTLHANPNEGYTFTNWTEIGTQVSANADYGFIVERDRDLVAHFQAQQYIIKAEADPEDGGTVEGSGGYDYGEECTLTATANEGYNFIKWTKDGQQVSTEPSFNFTVTESATYVAHFQKNSYTIDAIVNPSGAGTVEGAGTHSYGEHVALKAIPNLGYVFFNWADENGNQISTNPIWTITVTGDLTVVANFTQNVSGYVISASANPSDGGIVTGSGIYAEGIPIVLTAIANEGYKFVNWTENGVIQWLTDQYEFVVDRNRIIEANFEVIPGFTISAMAGANGSITPQGDIQVVQGNDQTFTMTPNNGCHITNVLVDGTDIGPVESYTFMNVNRNHTIYVSFSGMGVEEEQILNVNVYPNPAKDMVFVEGEGIEALALYDMFGNCLRSMDYNASNELNVSGLPQGAYVLKLTKQDGHVVYQKLVLN